MMMMITDQQANQSMRKKELFAKLDVGKNEATDNEVWQDHRHCHLPVWKIVTTNLIVIWDFYKEVTFA